MAYSSDKVRLQPSEGGDKEESDESFYDFARKKLSVMCCKRSTQPIADISHKMADFPITPLGGGDQPMKLIVPKTNLTVKPMDKIEEALSEIEENEQNMNKIKKIQEPATDANGSLDNGEKYGARKKTSDEPYEKWKKHYRRYLQAAKEKELARNFKKSIQVDEHLQHDSILYAKSPENQNKWNDCKKIRLRRVAVNPERNLKQQVYRILVTQFLARLDITDIMHCKKKKCWDNLEVTEDIVVTFTSATVCANVYHMRDYVEDGKRYIVDELIPETVEIWKTARNLFGIENVWTVYGSVQFITEEGSIYRMNTMEKFQVFLRDMKFK